MDFVSGIREIYKLHVRVMCGWTKLFVDIGCIYHMSVPVPGQTTPGTCTWGLELQPSI